MKRYRGIRILEEKIEHSRDIMMGYSPSLWNYFPPGKMGWNIGREEHSRDIRMGCSPSLWDSLPPGERWGRLL